MNDYKAGLRAFAAAVAVSASVLVFSGCSKENKEAPPQAAPGVQMPSQQDIQKAKESFDKGVQLALKGQHDEAIKAYEESLKLNPNSPELLNNLGFEYYDKGNFDKAAEYQQKSIALNPNVANAYYGLALALEKKGDKPGAIGNWRTFMQLSEPHSKWWMQAKAHIDFLEGKKPAKMKRSKKPAGHE